MKKTALIISALAVCFVIAMVTGLVPYNSEQAKAEEAAKQEAAAFIEQFDKDEIEKLTYKGVVSANEEIHAGEAEFVCGAYTLYYDLRSGKLSTIYKAETGAAKARTDEELLAEAAALLTYVQGAYIAQGCKADYVEGSADRTVTYTYEKDGIQYPAAMISYDLSGNLAAAAFKDVAGMISENYTENIVSEEEAYELAVKEAEAYIRERSPENAGRYLLDESSIECVRRFPPNLKRTVWTWDLLYTYDGLPAGGEGQDPDEYFLHYDFFFTISVDAENGKILENANNWN